jgi:hypothetical protein
MLDAQRHLVLFFNDAPGVQLQLVDPDPNVPDKLVGGHPSELGNDSGFWNVKPGGHARVMNASKNAVKIGVCHIRFDDPADLDEPFDGDAAVIEQSPPAKAPPPRPPIDVDPAGDGNAGSPRTPTAKAPPPSPPPSPPVDVDPAGDGNAGSPRTPLAKAPPPSPPVDDDPAGDGNAGSAAE